MERPFRLVHCADVHLDTPYRSRDEALRRRLADAGREAFRRVVELTLETGAHALAIAGDFFDGERLSFGTEAFLLEELDRLTAAGVTVALATGNHDPSRTAAGIARLRAAGPRLHVFGRPLPEEIVVPDRDGSAVGRIVGAGHATAGESGNLAAAFPDPQGPEPTVGLLHAQVLDSAGAAAHQPYAPCTRDDLARHRYAYWALGHVHHRQQVLEDPPACYPGNLQGRHFGETGRKGALAVTMPGPGSRAQIEFHALAPVRWETLYLDALEEVRDLGALRALARRVLEQRRTQEPDSSTTDWLVRFVLRGASPLAQELRHAEAVGELAADLAGQLGLLHAEVIDGGISVPVDLEEHRGRPHLLGLSLEVIEELREDDALLERLSPETLAGLDCDDPRTRREYLRTRLEGLEAHAVEALERGGSP